MKKEIRILARVAIFAALVFILSYFSAFIFNVNPAFFVVFAAGFLWGIWPGMITGVIGFFLYSNFGPYGVAYFPVMISQLFGIATTGLLGGLVRNKDFLNNRNAIMYLALLGFLSGVLFHLIVDPVDAWIHQPFWERLILGIGFSLITIISNSILFPLLGPVLRFMQKQERISLS